MENIALFILSTLTVIYALYMVLTNQVREDKKRLKERSKKIKSLS